MLLYIEAFIYLGWARILKSRPFAKIAPSLGDQMGDTSFDESQSDRVMLQRVSHAIDIISHHTFWESQCLVKALAGMKMLERRQIESTLYLGTGKDETGKMMAHAWLRSGLYYITGAEGMERFTVVSTFAKRIAPTKGEKDG